MEGVRGPGLQAGESGRPLLKHRRGRPLEKSRLAETLTPRAKANVKSPESTLCKYQAGKCCARGAAGHLGAPPRPRLRTNSLCRHLPGRGRPGAGSWSTPRARGGLRGSGAAALPNGAKDRSAEARQVRRKGEHRQR